ncbi:MAG: hypothetical protein MHM6MM_004989 [Cercozoa sp. M6MM]
MAIACNACHPPICDSSSASFAPIWAANQLEPVENEQDLNRSAQLLREISPPTARAFEGTAPLVHKAETVSGAVDTTGHRCSVPVPSK